MIEKVNPMHPDKVADRIAGAIVDLAYKKQDNPKIAVEVLIGHGECNVIIESSVDFTHKEVHEIVNRIARCQVALNLNCVKQDEHLSNNQSGKIRCGDNGIFKGMPLTKEQAMLSAIARDLYRIYDSDGKYILADGQLIICQSNCEDAGLKKSFDGHDVIVNPLGYWTGGIDVDAGATNRKLGSDMADSVTGGGLHGKDLSKADVSVNIYAFLKAQRIGEPVELFCAIGDETIDGKPYDEIVEIAREFIDQLGGFERFAEWGLF